MSLALKNRSQNIKFLDINFESDFNQYLRKPDIKNFFFAFASNELNLNANIPEKRGKLFIYVD